VRVLYEGVGLLSPRQTASRPRPTKAPFRRATRWDGAFPMEVEGGRTVPMTPEDGREVARYVAEDRTSGGPFGVVVAGETPGEDSRRGRAPWRPTREGAPHGR
jgi:hypothetical protein